MLPFPLSDTGSPQLLEESQESENVWPSNKLMMKIIEQILQSNSLCPDQPEFSFNKAAEKNFLILRCYNFDLGAAVLQPKLLMKLVLSDVKYGYLLPLPINKAPRIPTICMAPLNIQPH
jgi:hypothetical protein